jgi:hypothetical protein
VTRAYTVAEFAAAAAAGRAESDWHEHGPLDDRVVRAVLDAAVPLVIARVRVGDAATTTTLIVADWSSMCSACGLGADPMESTHHSGGTPLVAGEGCDARFAAIALAVEARGLNCERPAMRPDLPYVGRWPS